MMRPEIVSYLDDALTEISDMIIEIQPDPSQRPKVDELMKDYDRISGAVNDIIGGDFKEAAEGLSEQVDNLETSTQALKALDNDITKVQDWINAADDIVNIAIKILAIAKP